MDRIKLHKVFKIGSFIIAAISLVAGIVLISIGKGPINLAAAFGFGLIFICCYYAFVGLVCVLTKKIVKRTSFIVYVIVILLVLPIFLGSYFFDPSDGPFVEILEFILVD